MRKEITVILVIGIFVLSSSLAGTHAGKQAEERNNSFELEEKNEGIRFSLEISQPVITTNEKYAFASIKQENSFLRNPGCPMLPVFQKTFTFPLGTKIESIECIPYNIQTMKIAKKILPAPMPIPLDKKYHEVKLEEDGKIYANNTPYPEKWYNYQIGVGLENNEHVIFLSMEIYPLKYFPSLNILEYPENFEIKIKYELKKPLNLNDEYDLLIISPEKFADALQALVSHKENHGIKTKLVTTDEIYGGTYFATQGRDDAEKIKYFIKDAIEEWGIKYVLLVGGMKGQRFKWYVPVRYSHLDDNSSWETGYISDLYYADIYAYDNGNIIFDDWDSNGNGVFAEWTPSNKDILDLYPDVYVGRLPCRNKMEVKTMVDKIITYESNTYGQQWFKKMVVIGGDSFPDQEFGTDYIEGQVECDYALSFMEGFEHTRIYVEGGDYEFTPENAERILSEGEGFIYFSGHGNPASWATHPHNDFETWIDFGLKNIRALSNGNKLPVLVVGGCHNSQFNVTLLRFLKEGIWAYYLGEMSPECWGWLMTSQAKGGSIATIGNTGLGYGTVGDGPVDEVPDSEPDGIPDCIQYLGGWLEPHFFHSYNEKGKDILGETWGTTLTDYLNQFPIDWTKDWQGERPYTIEQVNVKTVQEWVLFGDPSLKIGGYP